MGCMANFQKRLSILVFLLIVLEKDKDYILHRDL